MGNAFSKKPLKEVMRENKRMVTRAIRELDREKTGLEREEKRLTMEIKKAARENQMSSVKVMAKVRILYVLRCCWVYQRKNLGRTAATSVDPLAFFLWRRAEIANGEIAPSNGRSDAIHGRSHEENEQGRQCTNHY
eukprot:scaffold294_cov221-Amphora_coffeaeformis.AAC.18